MRTSASQQDFLIWIHSRRIHKWAQENRGKGRNSWWVETWRQNLGGDLTRGLRLQAKSWENTLFYGPHLSRRARPQRRDSEKQLESWEYAKRNKVLKRNQEKKAQRETERKWAETQGVGWGVSKRGQFNKKKGKNEEAKEEFQPGIHQEELVVTAGD